MVGSLMLDAAATVAATTAALITAAAAILVGAVNAFIQSRVITQQRAQLKEQRDQFELQLTEQREQLRQQLGIARQGQLTERFTRAVEQLGNDKPAVRLGGIYALGQIAKTAEQGQDDNYEGLTERTAIHEVLTAFVQVHAPWPPRRVDQPAEDHSRSELPELREWAPDVQAALNVLARRTFKSDVRNRLRLVAVDLRRALLRDANLQEATFRDACLQRAVLADAHLQDAILLGTRLEGADLQRADLRGARVENANFEDCDCRGAQLGGVDLSRTRLRNARFEEADTSGTAWPA